MKISPNQLDVLMRTLPHWSLSQERGGTLSREFVFTDFAQAMGFMAQVALHAERRDHHPEWTNIYNRVTVTLTTHDLWGITSKDIELASLMDRIADALELQAQ